LVSGAFVGGALCVKAFIVGAFVGGAFGGGVNKCSAIVGGAGDESSGEFMAATEAHSVVALIFFAQSSEALALEATAALTAATET